MYVSAYQRSRQPCLCQRALQLHPTQGFHHHIPWLYQVQPAPEGAINVGQVDGLARPPQDVAGCGGGLSAGYSFRRGWLPPYPETTGYIIPTFLRYGEHTGDDGWIQRAVRAGDWESEIQLAAGGVRGGQGINPEPVVFNTGQVILGWCALHRTTGHDKYLESATRAADWLLQVQDRDGAWRQNTYEDTPHTYHSRVARPPPCAGRTVR